MPQLGTVTTTTTAVADSSWVKIASYNDKRQLLRFPNNESTSVDYHRYFGPAAPADTTGSVLIEASTVVTWQVPERIPPHDVWAYQTSGGSVDIKVEEGQ